MQGVSMPGLSISLHGAGICSKVLVSNYPVITVVTAVITVILVFWVRKYQMDGNMVTLRVHLFAYCTKRNYRLRDVMRDTPQFISMSF